MAFYRQGRDDGRLRGGSSARARAHPGGAGLPLPHRGAAGGIRAWDGLLDQRSGTGVAPVVLPLEQHPRRRATGSGGGRPAQESLRVREAGAAHARRSEGRRAGRELRRPVAVPARSGHGADGSQELRRQPAPVVQARDRDAVQQHRARGPEPAGAAGRRLHVRGRAAGAPLRHSERLRQPLPPRDAGPEQPATRHPGPGQHADGDVGRDADLAGDAGQVGAREPARRAAARAAAGRRGEPGSRPLVRRRLRCASVWSCTAPTRCARRATR